MASSDEHKSELHPVPTASSKAAVRGPEASSAAADSIGERERHRGARPKLAPHATGPHEGSAHRHGPSELPETYGVDEIEILCKDPFWYFAYWEVTDAGLDGARTQLGPSGKEARLVLRVFSNSAVGTALRDIRDVPVQTHHGRRYLEAPRGNALLRVAIGLLSPEGYFAPIAHSSLLRVPPQQPSSDTAVDWLHVMPARGDGRQHERITKGGPRPEHQERALSFRVGTEPVDDLEALHLPGPTEAGGASELSAVRGDGGGSERGS
jgi:hypothetical protein